jgi:hypothetical protein
VLVAQSLDQVFVSFLPACDSRASRSACVCAWPHAPTSKRECLLFYSPVCSARTAPTPDGQCNQSSLAALFQVRS